MGHNTVQYTVVLRTHRGPQTPALILHTSEPLRRPPRPAKCNSPLVLCLRMCAIRFERCVAEYGHMLQVKGFSPVWVRMCLSRCERRLAE